MILDDFDHLYQRLLKALFNVFWNLEIPNVHNKNHQKKNLKIIFSENL